MRKLAFGMLAMLILLSVTACTMKSNTGGSSGQGNNMPNIGSSSSQGNNPQDSGSSGQGNRQPGENQQVDSAYTIDDLIERVKRAGCISGNPETLDAKAIGAIKAVAYGNVVFVDYEYTNLQEFTDAYAANKVTINGKEAKIGAINGPFVMAFFDGNVDQKAVKAFHSLGFGQ